MTLAQSGPLSHVLAVDLSRGLAGSYAAMLLETVGAKVLRFEIPPGQAEAGVAPLTAVSGTSLAHPTTACRPARWRPRTFSSTTVIWRRPCPDGTTSGFAR